MLVWVVLIEADDA